MLGAEFSWSSDGGFKASGMPVPTKSVQTTTPVTVSQPPPPVTVMPFTRVAMPAPVTPQSAATVRVLQALQQQKAAAAMQTSAQTQQSSQASMLGRYALWGVLGLGAALIIYKLAKK